jgi:hypothetical protein
MPFDSVGGPDLQSFCGVLSLPPENYGVERQNGCGWSAGTKKDFLENLRKLTRSLFPTVKRLSPPQEFESFLLAEKPAIVDSLRTLEAGSSVAEDAQQCSQRQAKSDRPRICLRYDVPIISFSMLLASLSLSGPPRFLF